MVLFVANIDVKERAAGDFWIGWNFWIYYILIIDFHFYWNSLLHLLNVDLAEKQRFLTSVISKLEASEHRQSTAIAHAFALRAQVSLESGDRSNAIRDAHQAVKLKTVATSGTISLAYRVWADAEEDDTTKVISILQEWRKEQPAYQTKLRKEITELIEKGNL